MTVIVTKREAVFIPIKSVPADVRQTIKEKLEFHFYTEKACKECEWKPERPNDVCATCAAYVGGYKLANTVKLKENKYLKIPVGSSPQILEYLNDQGIDTLLRDKSPTVDIDPITFTGTLKPEQEVAVNVLIRKKRGVLKAPPRSGKTVSGVALICKLQKKTLIIASQRDWLMGFQETFIGSKTQAALTDLDPSRIKLCKTYEDFKAHDICMVTVQTFYSEYGQWLLRKLRDMFEVMIADEVHTGAADKYIQILAKFNCRIMLGLSATPSRKDSKFVLVDNVVGPVLHEVIVERQRPNIRLTKTKYVKDYKGSTLWPRMVSSLENDKKRLELIADCAIKDVEAGHMVLIPFAQTKPIETLVALINSKVERRIAWPFVGTLPKAKRDLYIEKARQYRVKVLVGTMKILSVGINIPRASCLYETTLSSNLENAEQRMMRVLTPWEDKPPPVIRYFLDDSNVRRNCLRNEYYRVLIPKLKPIISEKDKESIEAYFKKSSSASNQGKFDF